VSETKRKQRPKKGRVVRITPDLVTIISGEVRYVLPSDIHETVEDARGAAVIRAVRSRIKRAERPIPVRVKP